ncbi:MAG: hypothetical protein Kow0029_24330 [Candidatus Rifleibacteriota bacterium]
MNQIILILVFLNLVAFIAIRILKVFFSEEKAESQKVRKFFEPGNAEEISQPTIPIPDSSKAAFDPPLPVYTSASRRHSNSKLKSLLFLAALAVLIYYNQNVLHKIRLFNSSSNSVSTETSYNEEKPNLTIVGQIKVDGVVWLHITGTDSENMPVDGWVSEFAIKKKPAKKREFADAISKKLGLPTNEERITYIKKLRSISLALKNALSQKKQNPHMGLPE